MLDKNLKSNGSYIIPPHLFMQNTIDFSGIWIPSITPFDKEDVYKIDYKKFANLLDYLINEQKADGIVPFGTTGEYSTLSYEEEMEGLKFTTDYIQGNNSIAICSENSPSIGYLLNHLANYSLKSGSSLAKLISPSVTIKELLEIVLLSPGIVVLPVTSLKMLTKIPSVSFPGFPRDPLESAASFIEKTAAMAPISIGLALRRVDDK